MRVADSLKGLPIPTLGMLYPISSDLFVDVAGDVGIGTTSPTAKLTVAGTVEATAGGFRFPDGSLQATALVGHEGMGFMMLMQQFKRITF